MSTEKVLRSSIGFLVQVKNGNDEVSLAIELTQDINVVSSNGTVKQFSRGDRIYLNDPESHYTALETNKIIDSAAAKIAQLTESDEKRSNNKAGYQINTLRVAVATENKKKLVTKEA